MAVTAESSVWLFAAFALLLLYFPDGRLPGRRWRALPPVLLLTSLAHHAYGAIDDEPYQPPLRHVPKAFGPPPLALELLSFVADVVLLACLIACAASLPLRYRQADELRRRQLRWLALAGLAVPGFIVTCLVEIGLSGSSGPASVAVGLVAVVGIPLAITVALLRHDLYDVDRAIATTVAYALATPCSSRCSARAALAAGLLLGGDSTVAVAAATALGAAALAPLRRRLQRSVDARLYPLRRAALEAIDGLQRGIDAGTARPEQLAGGSARPPARPGPAGRLPAARKRPAGGRDRRAARRRRRRPGDRRRRDHRRSAPGLAGRLGELLREVAEASATLVELVRLRLELAEALREVEGSRARLVQAGDRERRRLERDLHDGAQQRLVSLGMALRVAQRHLGDGGVDVDGLLDQAVAELATAVAELRSIAHGLRPSSLDDGLHAALVALTRHVPIPIELHVDSETLPDEVAHDGLLRGQRGDRERRQARRREPHRRARRCATTATSRCGSATTGAAARASTRAPGSLG